MTQYRVTGIIDYICFAERRPDGTELWELARLEVITDVEATDPGGAEAVALTIASKHLDKPAWDGRPEVAMVDDQAGQMSLPMEVSR